MSLPRLFKRLPVILAVATLVVGVAYWKCSGAIAIGFGSVVWIPVSADTFWLPRPISLALRNPVSEAAPGAVEWTTASDGFQVGGSLRW